MLPSDLRRELARQTLGFMSWALSHTTFGIFCSWTVTIWGMASLLTGFVNLLVRARQLCSSRHPDMNINCFHVILTVFQTIDQSFNPLNLIRSSIKRAIVQLTSSSREQDLKIVDLVSEVFALKLRIRHLEISNHSENLNSENHYEWMIPSQSRDITDTFFLTNEILPRESLQHIYSVPKRSVLGYVSLDPGLNTADTQTGQMPAGPEPVFPAVEAENGAASKTV